MLEAKTRRVGADKEWEPARKGNSYYHRITQADATAQIKGIMWGVVVKETTAPSVAPFAVLRRSIGQIS